MIQRDGMVARVLWGSFLSMVICCLPLGALSDDDIASQMAAVNQSDITALQAKLTDLMGTAAQQSSNKNQMGDAKQGSDSKQSSGMSEGQSSSRSMASGGNDAGDLLGDSSTDDMIKQAAFEEMLTMMMPLGPEEVKTLRRKFNESQRASAFTEDTPPKPTSSSMVVDLSPGATPPIVRLSTGFVTSLVFVDATGEPWPIKAYDIGNPKAFNIVWNQDQGSSGASSVANTLLIQSITMYKQGNLAVVLEGLNTPVMLTLLPGQKAVDYRVDMQVPRMGPNAKPRINALPMQASPVLLDIINGIPPAQSKHLRVSGASGDVRAYLKEGVMYLRTADTVISPSWIATMVSAGGSMHAYQLPPTSVVLVLHDGKMSTLKVQGF